MKLFKKLAAAALAAVLALSMVGCGAGGTGSALDLKNEVLNYIDDEYYMSGKTATHTTDMDAAAAKLIESAAKAGAEEDNNDTVKALLEKQTIEGEGGYIAIFAPYTQLRTEFMQYSYIQQMYDALYAVTNGWGSHDEMIVKIGNPAVGVGNSIEMGAATGKIKGKNYLVLLVQNAKA